MARRPMCLLSFFFNDTATTEIYTLSLHDALPIWVARELGLNEGTLGRWVNLDRRAREGDGPLSRLEEHTSELQSPDHLVCRLLLEKKKNRTRERPSNSRHPKGLRSYMR